MNAGDSSVRVGARLGIHDASMRYARGCDRRDDELILSAFHADAVIDYGVFKGGPRNSPPGWCRCCARATSRPRTSTLPTPASSVTTGRWLPGRPTPWPSIRVSLVVGLCVL